ncbi:MAG: branched-chain amino acid transport system ATP-binding protein livM [Frankiales bacterium]|nr:branched-chain amino acid transport system ATP-binding protein livM [Frankiales bacterium]
MTAGKTQGAGVPTSGAYNRRANLALAAVLFIALPISTVQAMPKLLDGGQWLILDQAAAFALAAMSLNLLLGYTGQISLGHAGLLGVGAFASGVVTSRAELPMIVGLVVAVIASALVALIIGIPALRLRGLYLAIATVAFGIAMQYSVFRSDWLSAGSAGIALPRRLWGEHYLTTDATDNATFLVICLLLLLAAWIVDSNVLNTRVGRAFRAIRENEPVAQSFGINVTRYKLLAFVLSGAMAGLAGALYGHTIGFVNNESFTLEQSLLLVTMVIVGGMGHRLAVIIAAATFVIFPFVLPGLKGYELVVGAAILMLTVAQHPEGIADLLTARHRPLATDDEDDDAAMPELPNLPLPSGMVTQRPGTGTVLEVQDVTVRFGGLVAVDGASLRVPAGKIIGLIGPNGAGKSTLFNAVSGLVRVDRGVIRYRGQEIQGMRCDQRARLGIARSFQQVGLAKDLSMRENFLLAQHQLASYGDVSALLMLPKAWRTEQLFRERADEAVSSLGLSDLADMPVRNLSGGQQRLVEIGCLLVTAPDLVMLDEPSAGMAPAAAESLAERLRDLRDKLGRTVLLIEHNVPLVLDTCDYVYVLDAGQIIAEGPPEEITSQQQVIDAYFGAAVTA